MRANEFVLEGKSHDFMAGHCHVMAIALKQLHPDWQIRAHVGYDDDAADDTEYRVDHVYTVAPDGTAYDCRGRFDNEQQLVGPDTTGGVDTQYVNFGPEEIKQAMLRGELKRFSKQDLANAMQTATQVGKQDISEAPAGYKEIEFVCVNPRFPDATDPALQKKMYRGLKQIDGVVPLWQEWGDYSEGQASLSAIYQDSASRDKILSLAKQLGVEVDLEQAVSDDYVGRAMRGEHEGQQGLTEEINPDCFDPAFNDTQIFDGLTYRATAEKGYDDKTYFQVKVFDSNFQQVGLAKFSPTKRGLVSAMTSIQPEYQGQGLARNIYAYVRSLGNTIAPSRNQLPPGKAMWDSWKKSGDAKYLMRNVAERKQSPLEDFEGLQFRMVNDNDQLFVNAFDSSGGNELGHVTFDIGDGKELDPQNLYVKHKFRSQGIAQIMYDFVKSKGYKIQRSWDQTDAGAGFWDKHRGEERVWEQDVAEAFVTEDAMMGKLEDSGKIVRILKKAHTVPFSDEKNWLLIDTDPAKGNKGLGLKWVPADTRFTWVRPYRDSMEEGSLTEIENIDQSQYRGGKDTLDSYSTPGKKHLRALPGGSDLMYSITSDAYGSYVHIVDPGIPGITKPSIVAGLSLVEGVIPDSVQVGSITVDEDYRGRGLAKALYGIVLTIMKKTLISGSSQTPGGRRNWLSLASIPGVEIKGLLDLVNSQLEKSRQVDNTIDQLMQLGGQFVAKNNNYTYWAFDVVPGNGQLAPAVKNKLSKLYGYDSDNLLMATWTGGQQGVAEGSENNNPIANKIFFARSNKAPKGWSYDHIGFITQDGKQIQMSGHKGNDVYVTKAVTDDPEFPKQNIKIVSLSKSVSVPTTNSVGAENCGTFVANVLQANGIKGIDTQKIYSVFKKPQKQGLTEGATVTRIDSNPITDFGPSLKAYKHTDDWSQSGVDTGDDSYWKNKNLKTNTTKGLFAGDPKRTALYATGNAHETRYVEFTQDGQPIVYFDRKDLPAMRSRKTYLTVFDASDFRQLPTGEWFSENPGKPIKQVPIGDPFKYIASQGWIVRVTDNLDKVFNQVKNMHKAGKIAQYGAEGMNENKQGVAENFADGKNPQDKGDAKRHGINTKASVSSLRKTAKQGGRKGQLAHWLANMKSGRAKKK